MRFLAGCLALTSFAILGALAQSEAGKATPGKSNSAKSPPAVLVPGQTIAPGNPKRRLTFGVDWKLVHAGEAVMEWNSSNAELRLESAGLVSKLFKIQDTYKVDYEESFCATSSFLDAAEGKRHRETRIIYDRAQNHVFYTERDLLTNAVARTADAATSHCVHDVLGALLALQATPLEPGRSAELPITDGRRYAMVKIEAQEREELKMAAGTFKTIRHEAFLLNGVVYPRKGRVQVWLTDDSRRLPVKFVLRLSFPVGTVTLELDKEEIQ